MILPSRHFVYPAIVEEVERGALEVLVQSRIESAGRLEPPFLATCALGFRDAAAPTGIWSMPNPDWLCALSGGYAYLIDVSTPERFLHLKYRPVLQILCATHNERELADTICESLILFVGHVSILAWGRDGEAWESDRLSWEGLTNLRIEGSTLHGEGWDLRTDKDLPFSLDLQSGKRL
jgi:hypothetical protein